MFDRLGRLVRRLSEREDMTMFSPNNKGKLPTHPKSTQNPAYLTYRSVSSPKKNFCPYRLPHGDDEHSLKIWQATLAVTTAAPYKQTKKTSERKKEKENDKRNGTTKNICPCVYVYARES